MNKPYHKFVFNEHGLVGDFEAMYQAEDTEGFDAWGARDPRHLRMRLVNEILSDYNFNYVVDLGCGVGTVTQSLKRQNNSVLGIDISETAIAKAKETYPDIAFMQGDISRWMDVGSYDLASIQMVLAYVPEWRKVLETVAARTKYCVVCEYVPFGSQGAIRFKTDLEDEFREAFLIERKIILNDTTIILLGKVK